MKTTFHLLLISLLLTAVSGLHAQEAAASPTEPDLENPEEIIGTLILSDESAIQVLKLLEQFTGKIILRRQDISPAKINFNSNGEITKREAVLALESLLTLNGIMLTDMGGRFMKAVPATNVNSHVPEMLADSTIDRDPSQKIYAKLFKLDYLNAEQASATVIQPLLSQNSSIVPFPKSNALLVTDALVNLQRIESILDEADQPEPLRESVKFIKLDFIQASEAQNQIENLIQGSLKSYLEGNTSVSADERTNQLILVTHPGNVPIIMDVIENIDIDAAPLTSSEVFQLRQAKAEEVVPIIQDIISGQEEGRERDAEVVRDNPPNQNGNNQPANGGNNANPGTPAGGPAVSGIVESSSSLQFSNFVGLSADERTNSIVVYGTNQDIDTLRELIEKIDMPLPQVLIEAVITQVTLAETQTSGLSSISLTYDGSTRTFQDILMGTAGGISIGGGSSTSTDGDGNTVTNNSQGATVSLDNPSDFLLSAAISPTNSDSDSRVLSAPRIVVSHNEEGIINVSRSQPIITSSLSSGVSNNLNTRSSIEFRDIGIQLTVTPLIGADGTVQMVIEQTVENVVETVTIDGNNQPVIGKREATSTISVKNGEIIVLGGLQENSESQGNSYFPLIGRLPVVKKLFGASSNDYDRSEIIIFIRPRILTNPSDANQLANEYIENIEESEKVSNYMQKNTTGDSYLKGSKFEREPNKNSPKSDKPFIKFNWPDI